MDDISAKLSIAVVGTLVGLIPFFGVMLRSWLKSRVDNAKVEVKREDVEVDGQRLILQLASASIKTQQELSKLQSAVHEMEIREKEYQIENLELKAQVNTLTQDLEYAKEKIKRLEKQVIELGGEIVDESYPVRPSK